MWKLLRQLICRKAPVLLLLLLPACERQQDLPRCGKEVSGLVFTTLPPLSAFELLTADTVNHVAVMRFTSVWFPEICVEEEVTLRVNAQGSWTSIRATLHWSAQDSLVFSLGDTGPVWTGTSAPADLRGYYGDGPGTIWASVDFQFDYPLNHPGKDSVYGYMESVFGGLFIDPLALTAAE